MSKRPLLHTLLLLGLTPAFALAQPSAVQHDDPSRGATLPPTSAALADEAVTALGLNPAGLMQQRSLQLFYVHERSINRNEVADGLYAGNTFGPVGIGVGVEWLRSSSAATQVRPDRRKTTWALAAGTETVSFGAGFGFFSSEENPFLDRASTVDLGLMVRPGAAFSVGFAVRNLNEPREAPSPERPGQPATLLPRGYELAVGVRPFTDRITASVGYGFDEARGIRRGRLSGVLQAEVIRGLMLGAGVSSGFDAREPLSVQLALTFNFDHFGLTYAAGSGGDATSHTLLTRLSGAAYPALGGGGSVGMLDLGDVLTRGGNGSLSLLGASETDAYLELTRLFAQAERDPDLAALVLKVETLPEVGLGRAEELRKAVMRLRERGKKVIAVLFTAEDPEYLIASAADEILLVPQSTLLVNGLSANVTFLGGTMEKLGVKWDVARVGAYKNAPDQFTRKDMSAEQREAIDAYLDAQMTHLVETIARMRNLPVAQVRGAIQEGILTPKRAVELGLADAIIQPVDLDQRLKAAVPGSSFVGPYGFAKPERRTWGAQRRIAVVPVVGTIASGRSREDPFGFAEIAGAETVIRALEQAASDSRVAAIVVRVDSGGGDALASDLMYRAVLEARKKKPVIASMGDVAASGGYYAAMGAQRIFAEPTTITGSIGIFFMKPALGGLAEKLGVRQETIKRGDLSTLLNTYHPWTPEETAAAEKWVQAFYGDFITEVARARALPKAQVDTLARGRVWSGAAAKDNGLVDDVGSLLEAIDHARAEGGIAEDEPYELVILGRPSGLLGVLGGAPLANQTSLPEPARALLRDLGLPPSVLLEPGARALMPFHLKVR